MLKHPRTAQYSSNDYKTYKSLIAQTKAKSFPNRITGAARPHASWKWKNMLKRMVIPGERIAEEESEDTDNTDSVESYPNIASIGDIGESPDISSPGSSILSPGTAPPGPSIPPSPLHTRSYGKAKKKKNDREEPYKGYGVVYLPGDINGLARKLHLLAAEFFAGNTTVRNELVYVLDTLFRLKQFTGKEYADITITARLAAALYTRRVARYATKAMLTTAAKTVMRGTLNATKKAVPHLIAHKVVGTIAATKERKRVDIDAKHSQEPRLKKAFVDTGGININALIYGSGIVLD